jgi:hypothetical protein
MNKLEETKEKEKREKCNDENARSINIVLIYVWWIMINDYPTLRKDIYRENRSGDYPEQA